MAEPGETQTEEVEEEEEQLDVEAQARRRLALAQIRQYPDPVLRMPAKEVEAFDDDLASLVERMTGLLRDAGGLGLAATQVGILRRVFVFQREEEEIVALVNPSLVERSDEAEVDTEGCLSMQGVTVPVERATHVTLQGRTPDGEELQFELGELEARVVQHELDHLDGVLILDRTTDESRREALAILRPKPALDVLG
jgi:peptide deformylase